MSDYTPTTEEVRWQFSTDSPSEFMPEQFDRWLAEVKAQAWQEGTHAMALELQDHMDNHRCVTNPYRQGEEQ